MSKTIQFRTLVLHTVTQIPGQHGGTIREIVGAPKRVVGRILRDAEARGIVSSTMVDGNRLWFRNAA